MFRIGEFSRIARVSCRLLRYYEELGLLRPAHTDPDTGYRYYSASELPRLNRILVLKELGLSLEQVARIIDDELPALELTGMLRIKRAEAEQAIEAEAERLRRIELRIAEIESGGKLADDDVIVRSEPALLLLSIRERFESFDAAKERLATIAREVPARVPAGSLGRLTAIAHSPWFEPDELDVEIGFALARSIAAPILLSDGSELSSRELPAVAELACAVRIGPPEVAHAATARIGRFVENRGYRLAGPNREVFIVPPRPGAREPPVVEMQFPIERPGAAG